MDKKTILQKIFSSLFDNPVFIKDTLVRNKIKSRIKLKLPDYTGYFVILMLPIAIAIIAHSTKSSTFFEALKPGFILASVIQALYFSYKAATHSSDSIAGEKEKRTFENLAATIMSPLEIVKGKYWTTFYPLACELLLLSPLYFIIGIIAKISIISLITVFLLTMAYIAFFTAVGVYHSSKTYNTSAARSGALGTLFLLTLGIYLFGGLTTGILFGTMGVITGGASTTSSALLALIPNALISSLNPISTVWVVFIGDLMNRNFLQASLAYLWFLQPVFAIFLYALIGIHLFKIAVKNVGRMPAI
jgi:hypothetical protein